MERRQGFSNEISNNLKMGAKIAFIPGYKLYKANEEMIKRRTRDAFDMRLRNK